MTDSNALQKTIVYSRRFHFGKSGGFSGKAEGKRRFFRPKRRAKPSKINGSREAEIILYDI
ncbi:hypothetical protein, partial [Faecalicatena contorta]|uniref:hypothetical protein n=1 Tax=Faecalicatena contorta TaxID=39482 RepID=UPI001A9BB685